MRSVLQHLPSTGVVSLEGFDETANVGVEQMLVYDVAEEKAPGRISIPANDNENGVFVYVPFRPRGERLPFRQDYPLNGPQFDPAYTYVLTRMPTVATSRLLVALDGSVALERRERTLDVFVNEGLTVSPSASDVAGTPFAGTGRREPMQFLVSGSGDLEGARPTYIRLRFRWPPGSTSRAIGTHVVRTARVGRYLSLCVITTGSAPVRVATVAISPTQGVQLVEATASTSCIT